MNKYWIAAAAVFGLLLISTKTNMGATTGGVNNPGNIRNSGGVKFLGENSMPGDTFKSFKTLDYGIRAMYVILNSYYSKYGLNTISDIINRWAPPSDNNPTTAYVGYVADKTGIDPLAVVTPSVHFPLMVSAMSKMEGRTLVTADVAGSVYNKFFA
jgi:hypothetical protein